VAERDTPQPSGTQVLVRISYTGVCGSDWHLSRRVIEPQPGITIFGHEGSGTIAALGPSVNTSVWKVGDRVGVRWLQSVCKECECCMTGYQNLCPARKVSGKDVEGSFAQYALADSEYLVRIPEGVSDADAAPILCAGVTVYKALKVANLRKGSWVAVAGAGGGLGHLAIQYAKAMGLKPLAVDAKKREICEKLGAEAYVDVAEVKDVVKAVQDASGGGVHGAIVTASSAAAYQDAPKYLRRAGTLVCIGLPEEPCQIPVSPQDFIGRGIKIMGSSTGNIGDTEEALDFVAKGQVKPILTEKSFGDIEQIIADMANAKIEGRVVVKIDSS
jgi:propanol-preferring alcohol dehydrogenase